MELTKEIIERIEKETACSVSDEGDYYTIYVDNDCDEDYQETIKKSDHEIEDLIDCCDCYDIDEHFNLWWGAGRGEPRYPSELYENCKQIGENLEALARLLKEVL